MKWQATQPTWRPGSISMGKLAILSRGILIAGVVLLVSSFVLHGFRVAGQKRALRTRPDITRIAEACVTVAHAMTDESSVIEPTNPVVPTLLRSLSPHYLFASSRQVTVEFHGGMDHYGYRVRRSAANPKQWTISWYTEQGQEVLATISEE